MKPLSPLDHYIVFLTSHDSHNAIPNRKSQSYPVKTLKISMLRNAKAMHCVTLLIRAKRRTCVCM